MMDLMPPSTMPSFTGRALDHQGRGVHWEFVGRARSTTFTMRYEDGGGELRSEVLTSAPYRKLVARPERLDSFMDSFALVAHDRGIILESFKDLGKLPDSLWAMSEVLDLGIETLILVHEGLAHLRDNEEELTRLVKVLADAAPEGELPRFYDFPSRVTVQRTSLTEWLDLLDFLANGEDRETYSEFRSRNAGRVFPAGRVKQTRKTFYGASNILPLKTILKRYIQLSKRSQKLKKKLDSMPLVKILNALSFELPGTLLVKDTIELIDALKHVEKGTRSSYGYSIERAFGNKWAYQVKKHGVTDRLTPFVGHWYQRPKIITDLSWEVGPEIFILYGFKKLGPVKTVEILETLDSDTDGVCMRAFMELVRIGGFDPDLPASWTTVLLPKN